MLVRGTRSPKPKTVRPRRASRDTGECSAVGAATFRTVCSDAAAVAHTQSSTAMRRERTQRHDAR